VWRKVPDHENGFLQWLLFCEKHKVDGKLGSEKLDIPSDIAEIIAHPEKWDSQVVKTFLDENKDLLESIARIGLLPSQSAAGIDVERWSFVGARFTKQCTELLLADARLAAEAGDFERALRQVQAVSGLANHYSQIEAPSLLMETVSCLVRLNVQQQVMKYLLPALDSTPGEIARWREAIRSPYMEPSDFSSILRGDGWVSLGGFYIPVVNDNFNKSFSTQDSIPDPDALFDTYAQGFIAAADRAKAFSLDELIGGEDNHTGLQFNADHLSAGAQKVLEAASIGSSAWAKGWTRAMVLSARTDASLAIMQGEAVPLERFTGLPYVYDPVARTVQVPNDPRLREKLEIGSPLQLP
jgi:hypothetical protein